MRLQSRFALRRREGERRVRRKFLWWPRCFGGAEARWLCMERVVEEVKRVDVGGSGEWGKYAWKWVEIGFARGGR